MKYFFVMLLFFYQQTFSQQQVQGIVLNGTDSTKLVAASVFINTSTIGTMTGEDGKFILSGITATNFQLIIQILWSPPYTYDRWQLLRNSSMPQSASLGVSNVHPSGKMFG